MLNCEGKIFLNRFVQAEPLNKPNKRGMVPDTVDADTLKAKRLQQQINNKIHEKLLE